MSRRTVLLIWIHLHLRIKPLIQQGSCNLRILSNPFSLKRPAYKHPWTTAPRIKVQCEIWRGEYPGHSRWLMVAGLPHAVSCGWPWAPLKALLPGSGELWIAETVLLPFYICFPHPARQQVSLYWVSSACFLHCSLKGLSLAPEF